MSLIEKDLNVYDLKIAELGKAVKKDNSLGYLASKEFKKLIDSYKANKDLLSDSENERIQSKLNYLSRVINLKYHDFPDISLNVFYGGLMGTLLELTGILGLARGIIESDAVYIIGGLSALSLGVSIQGQRISAQYNHKKKLNECLEKII